MSDPALDVSALDAADHDLVEHCLSWHPPTTPEVVRRMEEIRAEAKAFGHLLVENSPRCPERTLALRHVFSAAQEGIGALARNQPHEEAAADAS